MSENTGITHTHKNMNNTNNECSLCLERKQNINIVYPNAKFDLTFIVGNVERIISSSEYIILIWIGDECCGLYENGHSELKTYVVERKSKFITVDNVITTLIEKDFQVPCEFNSLVDIIPLVNPIKYDNLDSTVFELLMKCPDCPL